MKRINVFLMSAIALVVIIVFSAFANKGNFEVAPKLEIGQASEEQQMMNLFVTHGHCSSPFTGKVHNLTINTSNRSDGGNPIENMELSFDIDPESFVTCRPEIDQITTSVKTPGVFISENKDMMIFKSTSVYTMGLDWYQVNGDFSIKGVNHSVKFFVSGIRDPKESAPSKLVLEGQLDLSNWGIDYDLIVNGVSNEHPTKWLHINMKIDMPVGGC